MRIPLSLFIQVKLLFIQVVRLVIRPAALFLVAESASIKKYVPIMRPLKRNGHPISGFGQKSCHSGLASCHSGLASCHSGLASFHYGHASCHLHCRIFFGSRIKTNKGICSYYETFE
jgi:hypothetical protein